MFTRRFRDLGRPNPLGVALLACSLLGLACDRSGPSAATQPPQVGPATASGPAASFDAVWTEAREDALRDALATVPGAWPTLLHASLGQRIPALRAAWLDAYARHPDEAADPAGARACLDAQLVGLDVTVAAIVADPELAARAWPVLEASLADPDTCLSAPANAHPSPELAAIERLLELGALAEAAALLAALGEGEPTPAQALRLALARGRLALARGDLDGAAAALATAEPLAATLGADARARVAALGSALAAARGQPDAAAQAQREAVAAAREQTDPWLWVAPLRTLAQRERAVGQPQAATAALVEAIGIVARRVRADDPRLAQLQIDLAEIQLARGQVEAAHDGLMQARDSLVATLGPDHPDSLATVEALGRLLLAAGQPGDAQLAFLDLLEIHTDLYGVKHWRTANTKLELADALMAVDEHASARDLYAEALVPLFDGLGASDPRVVRTQIHLGRAELALGNLDAAEVACQRGRDLARGVADGGALAGEGEACLAALAAVRRDHKKPTGKR